MSFSTVLVKVLATLRPFSLDRPRTMFFTMDREGRKREGPCNRSPLCGRLRLTPLEPVYFTMDREGWKREGFIIGRHSAALLT